MPDSTTATAAAATAPSRPAAAAAPSSPPPPPPPGPVLQAINAALHREPVATAAYGAVWCLVLCGGIPIAVLGLLARTLLRLWWWYGTTHGPAQGRARAGTPPTAASERAPSSNRLNVAIVITGCDSGFGKELALYAAAHAGYTVFAGCLNVPTQQLTSGCSVDGKNAGRVIPLAMDVTSDDQVRAAVATVQAWLAGSDGGDGDGDGGDDQVKDGTGKRKKNTRALHALINNAGVGTGGVVDWAELSDFQFCIDGT